MTISLCNGAGDKNKTDSLLNGWKILYWTAVAETIMALTLCQTVLCQLDTICNPNKFSSFLPSFSYI